jgi:hypothetical protein
MTKIAQPNMKEIILPPVWCGGICRNAMNEVCIEHCAVKRDCSAFEPLKGLSLADLPRFPKTTEMTREEKFTSVTIYLAKIVDHLQGVENDHKAFAARRHNLDHSRSGTVLEGVKVQDLLSGIQEADTPSEIGKEREDQTIRPSDVVAPAD